MMKRVYIAGPIRKGDLLHNMKQADDAVRALINAGFAFYNPMWSCYAGSVRRVGSLGVNAPPGAVVAIAQSDASWPEVKFENWMENDYSWINVCHALLRLPGESTGADSEERAAREAGIPVFYTVKELIEHFEPTPPFINVTFHTVQDAGMQVGDTCLARIRWGDVRYNMKPGDKYRVPGGWTVQIEDTWCGKLADVPVRVAEWSFLKNRTGGEHIERFMGMVVDPSGNVLAQKTKRIK